MAPTSTRSDATGAQPGAETRAEGTGNHTPSPAAAATGDGRRRFLVRASGAGGATALAALLGGCSLGVRSRGAGSSSAASQARSSTPGPSKQGDLKIMNYALTLEYLEATFYAIVDRKGLFSGQDASLISSFGRQEADHATALRAMIRRMGGKPVPKPRFTPAFAALTKDRATALRAAAMVENVGAAAYLGAAPMILDNQLLIAALTIHSVEARHAAALNKVAGSGYEGHGGSFVGMLPDGAFAQPATMPQVLKIVKPYIASG